jgi:integrase
MASLHKDPRGKSPYWYMAYRRADGTRGFRSTGKSKKSEAEIVMHQILATEGLAGSGEATRERMTKIINDTLERLGQTKIEILSVKQWLDRWLKTEEGAVSENTLKRYTQVIRDFRASLGPKEHARLTSVTTDDVTKFRDELLQQGRYPQTVNLSVRTILKRPFKVALEEGLIERNPIAAVRALRGTTAEKGVFTPEQIAKLVVAAKGDWKALIVAGYYTGARLSDLARLQWSNIDLEQKTITFLQQKTQAKVGARARIKIPIHPQLEEYLLSGSLNDNPNAPVFPELYLRPKAGKSGLSMAFKRIMEQAGIDGGLIRERLGSRGKSVSALSFHSLRHSFTSALANAGVTREMRQLLTGHADEKSHSLYTHHEFERLTAAVASISRLPKGEEK